MIQRRGTRHVVSHQGTKVGSFKTKADAALVHNALRLGIRPDQLPTKGKK